MKLFGCITRNDVLCSNAQSLYLSEALHQKMFGEKVRDVSKSNAVEMTQSLIIYSLWN